MKDGSCDACGAPDATQSPWVEKLCPPCTTRQAIAYAATDHLNYLVRGVFSLWLMTWKDYEYIIRHATDEASVIAQTVVDEELERLSAAMEGVQPSRLAA